MGQPPLFQPHLPSFTAILPFLPYGGFVGICKLIQIGQASCRLIIGKILKY